MKPITTLLLFLLTLSVAAQPDTLQPPYKRFPTVPPFQLVRLDSASSFTKDDLPKNQQLLIMFFNPDCDHCQHQTQDLVKDIASFKNVQIVMASYEPLAEIKAFYEKYQLANHPNIHIGRDTKFLLPPFYRIPNLPYLALYDQKGDLIRTFAGNVKTARLLVEFRL